MSEAPEMSKKLKVLDLFSGIGGFSLGLERTGGFETVAFCEIEEYPQKVLKKIWPDVMLYQDVREVNYERLRADGISVDVITGGFPCQDISVAGNQAGIGEGTRSGLWSECARLLGELRPRYAIFENVTALLSGDSGRWFQRVLWDISSVGYDAEWHCIPASELGAHHHRDRVWIIAYTSGGRWRKECSDARRSGEGGRAEGRAAGFDDGGAPVADADSKRGRSRNTQRKDAKNAWEPPILTRDNTGGMGAWDVEPNVGRVADGVPNRSHRLKALGNAVVPQIPELIGRAILNSEYAATNCQVDLDAGGQKENCATMLPGLGG